MKVQIQRIEPPAIEPSPAERWIPADPDAPMWTIEELGSAGAVAGPVRPLDWRLWCGVALAAAIAVLGFIGPAAPADGRGRSPALETPGGPSALVVSAPAAASAETPPPLTLTEPAEGGIVEGAVVGVAALADRRLGTIELAVVLDDAVLGWVTTDTPAAGPVRASIPVFAPPLMVRAEIVVATLEADGTPLRTVAALDGAAIVRRAITLRPRGAVGLWTAIAMFVHGRPIVTVSGCAPRSVGRVKVRLVTSDGRILAGSSAVVARDETRPGFIGGYAMGLGSFEVQLAPAGKASLGSARVEVDWSDKVGGGWGTSVMTVDLGGLPMPSASGVPAG